MIHLKRSTYWLLKETINELGRPLKLRIEDYGDELEVVVDPDGKKVDYSSKFTPFVRSSRYEKHAKDVRYKLHSKTESEGGCTTFWFKECKERAKEQKGD